MFVRVISPLFVFALLTTPCRTQPQEPASNPSTSAKPAAPASSSTQGKKPKKVWTDENIGSVKGSVSVVGDADSSSEKGSDKTSVTSAGTDKVRQRQIENYRSQIRDLQSRIDAADKRIAQLKNFKGENTSPKAGIDPNRGYNMVPVEEQVKQLEDKKKQLQGKIEDVENEARKNGIEPGELR
jgi:hypothetical protein